MQLLVVLLFVVVGACGTVLMKVGAERVVHERNLVAVAGSLINNWPLLCGIGLQLIPLAGWTFLLKTMPLSKLQPMIALTYVITPLFAVLFLGEHIPSGRMLGIGLIVMGVILVGVSQ
ncbi:EamA family transporter [Lysobacter arvi]|uniref:EamA family transporter n=1 Tax=Lysobacter arvi TaxID=3038776 RepID=A0ABU1CFC6_9GAMM|nr:EamA family transporter [Lysobacter arvi]MDR0183632.1 EamA family transporter [Lysobacter arvi]